VPRRVKTEGEDKQSAIISALSSLAFFILLVVDVRLLFPYLQSESGEFTFANIGEANIVLISILAAVAILAFVGARVYLYIRKKKKAA
jgi:hypothetical protein